MIFGKYINRYYLKHAPVLLLGLAALLTVDYIQLLIPQLYRLVINGVNLGQVVVNGETLLFTKEVLLQHICLPMIWIVVLMVIGRFLWRICFFGSAVRVAADLRERMFDHSRRLSQQYYQVNKVGNLMSLYTNDLDTIQECFGDGVLMFFDALTLGLLALYKMWTMDVRLTLLALIPALIMFAIGTQMSKVMTRRWEERQEAFSGLSDFAQENFSGIAVIKAFVKEYKELQAFRKLNKENEEINVTYTKIATLLEVLVTLFVESVICIILGYGGYLVYQGRFNAGQLVEYIGYFEAIVWPIMAVSMLIEKTSRGRASLNRITELLDARQTVAFVGSTGSGKSTILSLICRNYEFQKGQILIDGIDIRKIRISSLRRHFGQMLQDVFLFSGTIRSNIVLREEGIPDSEIMEVCRYVNADKFINKLDHGLDEEVRERGNNFSAGQRQLLSFARTIIHKPSVMILDEATANIDTETELLIQDSLEKMRTVGTMLIVAHRLSTIQHADNIIVLSHGKILEQGTHQQLLARHGRYYQLYTLQYHKAQLNAAE